MCSIRITFIIHKSISTVYRTFPLDRVCCFTLLVRFHGCLKLSITDMNDNNTQNNTNIHESGLQVAQTKRYYKNKISLNLI